MICIIGRDKLLDKHRRIYPFDYNLFDGDDYVLTAKELTTLNYLEGRP